MAKQRTSYPIEFVAIGNQVKITAIDPETGIEASVICPHTITKKDGSEFALRKLHYILRKKDGTE